MKKRNQITFLILLIINTIISAQNVRYISGKYSYSFEKGSYWFNESLQLNIDSSFNYECNRPFIKERIVGRWHSIRNEIILNSDNKSEKIKVTEKLEVDSNKFRVCVYNKQKEPINYKLFIVNNKNDTIEMTDQWECSLIKDSICSFYIADSKGLFSPKYLVKNKRYNSFYVLFETKRIFDNEIWELKGDSIIPKDSQGNNQSYFLTHTQI
jgi:hypothetical protein